MGLQADGAQCVVCETSDCEGAGGGSDACDADVCTLVCCFKRGGRDMLGLQLLWPGAVSCFCDSL